MTDTIENAMTYTRKDAHLLGEHPMEGTYTTANRYQVGDSFYLITRNRRNASENQALAREGLGYGPSYEEFTQMDVVLLPDQHGTRPWVSVTRSFVSEDEEDGIRVMLAHANGNEKATLALLESLGAVDITGLPILAEALKAVEEAKEVDVDTDPVVEPEPLVIALTEPTEEFEPVPGE